MHKVPVVKIAVVILSDTETPEDLGRVVNALVAVKEFQDAKDEVTLIFDGAGTKWIGELAKPTHAYHSLFEAVREKIAGVCCYCAGAFQATENAIAHVPLLAEYDGHPSFRKLIIKGYQVLIF
ncbi:MAG: hypothetical protein A3E85_00370 [Gammaproteobacteria bacterium RIFCSPHIGHO2_12_FULL_45_12]|nr:MAG: hypothetical protein A3E85_00370 [Gammaproteobacteria bacterium RIFCSPHIGHO2_12_FULL_45_12]